MNKKGFTLVELISVIVMIGILLILASTIVINHMTKVKKNAAYRNAISYVKAIDDYNFVSEGTAVITSGSTSTITPILKDSYEGTKPKSGNVVVNSTTKKVTSATLYYDNYVVTYNGTRFTISHQ